MNYFNEDEEKSFVVEQNVCDWSKDEDGVYWTSCGEGFIFTEPSSVKDHNFKFCCYCGKKINDLGELK